jgi:hypothetical protein
MGRCVHNSGYARELCLTWDVGDFPISSPSLTFVRSSRTLPFTGIIRLHQYGEPLRLPRRPACLSRASGRSSLTTSRGLPCRVRFPCVHAVATAPAQRLGLVTARQSQPYRPSPIGLSGRPVHRLISKLAQRSLALWPAHSRSPYIVTAFRKASAISLPP